MMPYATEGEPTEWEPMSTAPRDGTPFLALNHDREVWVTKWIAGPGGGRFAFRTNKLWVQTSHEVIRLPDGREARVEDKAKHRETWESGWTFWTRGYEFAPTAWLPLPEAPRP